MKSLSILLALLASPLLLPAEEGPNPSFPGFKPLGGDPADGSGKFREKFREKFLDDLPPELRSRFEAAREKALQDPKIQDLKKAADASGENFRNAMREAMMKADPGLADALKKIFEDKSGNKGFKQGKSGEHQGPPPGMPTLSDEERQKLMAAREKVKDDPAVQASEAKKRDAKTPEERGAAAQDFHKAMQAALLKEDPSLAPILEKIKPPQYPQKPGESQGKPDKNPAPDMAPSP